jgi:hypothetical protein
MGWDPQRATNEWSEEQFAEMLDAAIRMNNRVDEDTRISDNVNRFMGIT